MLVYFKVASLAVQYFILTLSCYMLLELFERFSGAACAHEWATNDHVAFTLLNVIESILKLEYLITVSTFYSDLINYVV